MNDSTGSHDAAETRVLAALGELVAEYDPAVTDLVTFRGRAMTKAWPGCIFRSDSAAWGSVRN